MNFEPLQNTRILDAAKGKEVDKIPVWIMRQAGRYLPEFRELRSKYDFFTMCQTPELATKVTLMPIERFDLDAAIIFSDILVIPQALGMEVELVPGRGMVFPNPLVTPQDISTLKYPCNVYDKLKYVFDAITMTRYSLKGKVPLLGFSGAPWTLMCFMVEGESSSTKSKAKAWLYKYPEESKKLLDLLADVTVDYIVGQIEAGAQMIQLFETLAEYLNKPMFDLYCYSYIKKINQSVKLKLKEKNIPEVPMAIFAKGAHYALEELSDCGYDVISIDWTIDPTVARDQTKSNITLQGNLDPCALYAPPEELKNITETMVKKFGKSRYIANLGHGIYPDMNPDHVKVFIDTVHSF
ncbi:uroporphyrinogen decarboxylase [Planococcus citri]|uniref:uroporphyrinogen decarboxylase n=1 Tax=Planococcus citri TaxID=170843 RepID=UPI0031F729DE